MSLAMPTTIDHYEWTMKHYSGVTYKYQSIYKIDDRYYWGGGNPNGYTTIVGAKIAIGQRIYV